MRAEADRVRRRLLRPRASAVIAVAVALCPALVQARQVDVYPSAGTPIAAALRAAQPFDTVMIHRGTYREPTLTVVTSMLLRGEPGAVIDGAGQRALLIVRASHVTVEGLTLRNTGFSGIDDRAALRFVDVADCRAIGNTIVRRSSASISRACPAAKCVTTASPARLAARWIRATASISGTPATCT